MNNNEKLVNAIKLVQHRSTTGSLAVYEDYEITKLQRFRLIYNLLVEETITRKEPFPGRMLTPKKMEVTLPDNVYILLVKFYQEAYEPLEFITIASSIEQASTNDIIVLPKINQFGRIQIGNEVFRSTMAPRYMKNSYIIAKFITQNENIELFSGQVQFYFEHEVRLPKGKQVHHLAFVRWFLPAQNNQIRFHCRISNDIKSCNVELWQRTFYDYSRDSIIPIHHIYSQFIPTDFSVGIWNSTKYMVVIPINRHFHL